MHYKHNIIYRLICTLLVFVHICVFSLRDAAVVFAQEASPPEAESSSQVSSSTEPAPADPAKEKDSKKKPKDGEGGAALESMALSSSGDGSQSQSNSSSFNLNALQNVNPSLFTGALTYSIPIAVSAGRKGIQPNIALAYSSQSGNGALGMGWSLDLGSIERSTKNGVPKYNSSDTFIFKSGGSA
ncbi:SpvB/TcaC N-terminal domain-containing protein, partial [Candidatus Omnitrophota bacterium]